MQRIGYSFKFNKLAVYLFASFVLLVQGCNYNYYRGQQLEEQGRFEEANIEYHRAYIDSPDNDDYREAFQRTALKTTRDLMERYARYVKEKSYRMAFRMLEKANTLTPEDPEVQSEMKKWYKILLAGKVELAELKSLNNQIPLTDQIILEIRFNTPNVNKRLEAEIDYKTRLFSIEDILYDPPQNLLMLYSINSIGVKLVNSTTRQSQFKKFVDFKIPILVDVKGELLPVSDKLTPVGSFYPVDQLVSGTDTSFWYPSRSVRYSLELDSDRINVTSTIGYDDFLPQILYINRKDRRYFLDFGHLQIAQRKRGGLWTFRRLVQKEREYMSELEKNLILNPYFYYREGGYPFVSQK